MSLKILLFTLGSSFCAWGAEQLIKNRETHFTHQRQLPNALPNALKLDEKPILNFINSQEALDNYSAWFLDQFYTFIETELKKGNLNFSVPKTASPYWTSLDKGFAKVPGISYGKALESLLEGSLALECFSALVISKHFLIRKLLGAFGDAYVSSQEELFSFQPCVLIAGAKPKNKVLINGNGEKLVPFSFIGRFTVLSPPVFSNSQQKNMFPGSSFYVRNILAYRILADFNSPDQGENLIGIKHGKCLGFGGWFNAQKWPEIEEVFDHLIEAYREVCNKPVDFSWINRVCEIWPQFFSAHKEALFNFISRKTRYEAISELFPNLKNDFYLPDPLPPLFCPVDQLDSPCQQDTVQFMSDPSLSNEELKAALMKLQQCLKGKLARLDYEKLKALITNKPWEYYKQPFSYQELSKDIISKAFADGMINEECKVALEKELEKKEQEEKVKRLRDKIQKLGKQLSGITKEKNPVIRIGAAIVSGNFKITKADIEKFEFLDPFSKRFLLDFFMEFQGKKKIESASVKHRNK